LASFVGLGGIAHADAPRRHDGHVLAGTGDARLADRQTKSSSFGTSKLLAVEDFVLEEDDRVGIADRRLEQALGVGRRYTAPRP
jgi:hypothetical protein